MIGTYKQINIMSDFQNIRTIWSFINDELDLEPTKEEMSSLLIDMDIENDVYAELDGTEWRIIHEDVIDDIATDEIKDLVQDCYLNGTDLDKLWWLEIDWEKTARNCITADGYGHHFSSYDGSEFELNGWYFFRVN